MRAHRLFALALTIAGCAGPTSTIGPTPTAQMTTSPSPIPTAPAPTVVVTSTPAATPSPTAATATPVATPSPTSGGPQPDELLSIELFVEGLPGLTFVTNAGDGSDLLYAVAQEGQVFVLGSDGAVQEEPFLDIVDRVGSGGERGLLGLAFHPDFESNGRYFVNYTNKDGDTVISEFARSDLGGTYGTTDPASERMLLTIQQPFENHNGGMVAFGPDDYLYIGMGDGGSGGDPMGNGQGMISLLGKMLRIDLNSGDPYGIPGDNPFADGVGLPEIWSLGWRNPWRFSFDHRGSGAMFVGDVGQDAVEEIDAEPAGQSGRNYGWNIMEGGTCYRTDPCNTGGLTMPVAVNHRENGECAITGGYVYRGAQYPELNGTYIYTDYCTGQLMAFDAEAALSSGTAEAEFMGDTGINPTSFGEDEQGELYLVNEAGEIYKVVATRTRP